MTTFYFYVMSNIFLNLELVRWVAKLLGGK